MAAVNHRPQKYDFERKSIKNYELTEKKKKHNNRLKIMMIENITNMMITITIIKYTNKFVQKFKI